MTYHCLIFATRLKGTTPSQFKDHYEKHVDMIMATAGETCFNYHKRWYLTTDADPEPKALAAGKQGCAYDCIAELEFDDEAHFQRFYKIIQDPENTRLRNLDEDKFLERDTLTYVMAEDATISRPSVGKK